MMGHKEKLIDGDEYDAVYKAPLNVLYNNTGLRKYSKKAINKRARKKLKRSYKDMRAREAYPLRRWALVIDNADPDELGKVQVRVLPELNGVANDSDLPWASPRSSSCTGVANGVGKHNVPDEGSYISVIINDKYWKSIDYIEESPYIKDQYIYSKFNSSDIEEMDSPEYPQPKFEKTKDGTVKFHNTDTGEIGLLHPSGAYIFFDKDGNIYTKNIGSFTINEGSDSAILYSPNKELLEALCDHIHISPTGECTVAMDSSGKPLSSLKSKLNDMKSDIVLLD